MQLVINISLLFLLCNKSSSFVTHHATHQENQMERNAESVDDDDAKKGRENVHSRGMLSTDPCHSWTTIGDGIHTGNMMDAAYTEVQNCGLFPSKSDWYQYVATCTGEARILTCENTFFDTVLAAYSAECDNTYNSFLACSDDMGCGDDYDHIFQSTIYFGVQKDQPYYVEVGGYFGDSGNYELNVSCQEIEPMTNDVCSTEAIVIGEGSFVGTTYDAHDENTFVNVACFAIENKDVWYQYVATCTDMVLVSLCESSYLFDTIVAVWEGGCDVSTAKAVACSDGGCGLQSMLQFKAVTGRSYWIQIGGFYGATGSYQLDISCDLTTSAASTMNSTTPVPSMPTTCNSTLSALNECLSNDTSMCRSCEEQLMAHYSCLSSCPDLSCNKLVVPTVVSESGNHRLSTLFSATTTMILIGMLVVVANSATGF